MPIRVYVGDVRDSLHGRLFPNRLRVAAFDLAATSMTVIPRSAYGQWVTGSNGAIYYTEATSGSEPE